MRAMQSDYMHWAKFKPPVRYPLTASEVPHFRLDGLPLSIADLDLDGASHPRYAPLREAIAERYQVMPEQVVAADGTSMANFLAMAALIAPGDDVLIEQPTYEPLVGAASFLGANIRRFERSAPDFALHLDAIAQATGPRTRLVVLTNLHNPSGSLADETILRKIGDLAADVGARILIDEVYLDASSQRSSAHLGPAFIATNSLTKVYGLSGLRCGWILAEPELAERMWRLNDLMGVNQAHPAERLACLAFKHLDTVVGDVPRMLAGNRARFNAFLEGRSDLECAPAGHGLTAFPRWHGGDTGRLDHHLRDRYDAAIVPGRWFEKPNHFRVALCVPSDLLEEGLARLGAALDDLS